DATFHVNVTFNGEPYASDEVAGVKYLLFTAENELIESGEATFISEGQYDVYFSADFTRGLDTGGYKMEVVVTVLPVSIPSVASIEFQVE
ncbi:MAG TPA: hypothetical protein VJ965_01180, partial [Anaerolineales bacterium]|nr:hypothetical protein [Anaerolineales bacterium]